MTLAIDLAGTGWKQKSELCLWIIEPKKKPAFSKVFPHFVDGEEIGIEERFSLVKKRINKASVILYTQAIQHTMPGTFSLCGNITLNANSLIEPVIRLIHYPSYAFYTEERISSIPIWFLSIEDIPPDYPKDEVARKVKMLLPDMMVFLSRIVYERVFVVFSEQI